MTLNDKIGLSTYDWPSCFNVGLEWGSYNNVRHKIHISLFIKRAVDSSSPSAISTAVGSASGFGGGLRLRGYRYLFAYGWHQ